MQDDGEPTEISGGFEQAKAVLAEATDAYRRAFGERLLATYALGSMAHGGYSPLVSDVDLGLVFADPLRRADADTIQRVAEAFKAGGSALHDRLSVFWGTPSTLAGQQVGGRFPPLDRLDLIQHGQLMYGQDARENLPRPSRTDLLVAGAEFALDFLAGAGPIHGHGGQDAGSYRPAAVDAVVQIRRPELLLAQGLRRVTKLVLFPVRFLYSAETGLVGTNHSAADHYLATNQAPGAALVAAAVLWRDHPPDRALATALLKREMIPLYLHYIDDHTTRLTAADRPDLSAAFIQWRDHIAI